jgi:hypothetical protein
VFNKLNDKEDLAVKIAMTRASGAAVAGEITVRTMFRFGLNITRVGAESFTALEYSDLYSAVDVTRSIYERRDVTLSVDRRHITNAQAGGFTVITSESEARDLFEQWSDPTTPLSMCLSSHRFREPDSTASRAIFPALPRTPDERVQLWWIRAVSLMGAELDD